MTREEEIKSVAEKESVIFYKFNSNCGDCYEGGFIDGAKWADETMIDKACRWLEHQEEMIGISFEEDFIERFKKTMEE